MSWAISENIVAGIAQEVLTLPRFLPIAHWRCSNANQMATENSTIGPGWLLTECILHGNSKNNQQA